MKYGSCDPKWPEKGTGMTPLCWIMPFGVIWARNLHIREGDFGVSHGDPKPTGARTLYIYIPKRTEGITIIVQILTVDG